MLSQLAKFPQWGTVSAAIIPQICQLIYTTEISNWANFANVLHKKFAPKMSNHSPLSGNPVLPVLCWNWDRPAAPSPHQLLRHIRSMNWQLSKLFELDSNITQISTHSAVKVVHLPLIFLSELIENKPLETWLVELLLIPPTERMRIAADFSL